MTIENAHKWLKACERFSVMYAEFIAEIYHLTANLKDDGNLECNERKGCLRLITGLAFDAYEMNLLEARFNKFVQQVRTINLPTTLFLYPDEFKSHNAS